MGIHFLYSSNHLKAGARGPVIYQKKITIGMNERSILTIIISNQNLRTVGLKPISNQ